MVHVQTRSLLCAALLALPGLSTQRFDLAVRSDHGDQLGAALAACGDVNGDGVPDFVVGAPQPGLPDAAGYASIHSGVDGSLLLRVDGLEPRDRFGVSVAGVGDVNGDGVPDVIVGTGRVHRAKFEGGPGYAQVVSGADGSRLHTFRPAHEEHSGFVGYGFRVAGLGDVDGDGTPDVAVSSPLDERSEPTMVGHVELRSGRTGAILHRLEEAQYRTFFGVSLHTLGDVDGDGVNDLAVGAPVPMQVNEHRGAVHVFSGASGERLWRATGGDRDGDFGVQLTGVGDWNGDGAPDLAVLDGNSGITKKSAITLVSGADGSQLLRIESDPSFRFHRGLASAGDLDHDGRPELLVGNSGQAPWLVRAVSTAPGAAVVREWVALGALSTFGAALLGLEDVDGDGVGDVLVGDTWYGEGSGQPALGRVFAYSGRDGSLLYTVTGQ